MEGPGSCCLGRFQHLLRKKGEALRETAEMVFLPGPRPIRREISEKWGESALPKGGKREQHRGRPTGTFLLGSHAEAWALSPENCHGNAWGEASHTAQGKWQERHSPRPQCPAAPFRARPSESRTSPRTHGGLAPRRPRHLNERAPAGAGAGRWRRCARVPVPGFQHLHLGSGRRCAPRCVLPSSR